MPDSIAIIKDQGMLRQVRQEWKDFLEAIPYFDDVPIMTWDEGDIQNEHDRNLGVGKVSDTGSAGVNVVLMTVTASPSDTGEAGPVYNDIKMAARVYENPTVNRGQRGTGKTFEAIAEKIAGYTHGKFFPISSGSNSAMIHVPPGIVLGNDPNWPNKDAHFIVPGNLTIQMAQAQPVTFAVNAGVVTMATQTAGAAIFYTVNGNRPNTFSNLYLQPTAFPPGSTIRARAYLAGYLVSHDAKLQL